MLLYLAQYLSHYIKSFRVFEYVTFRALCACLFALISSIYYGNNIINWLTKLKIGQSVRDDGPKTHMVKVGTPTMGGVLIILSVTFTTLLFVDLSNLYVYLVLFVLMSTGLIGFIDDYKKIVYKNSKGISARAKLFFQSMIAIVASIVLIIISYKHMGLNSNISILQNGSINHIVVMHSALNVVVPFIKNSILPLSMISFLILSYLVIVGSSNAVNLTDGLDGLVSFPVMTVTIGLAIFAYIAGHKIFSGYLLLPYISGSQELVVFCGALIGACLGFLWFNAYPALVFMGDVGALAIGAALGTIAIIVQQELTFAIMGGVFVLEAISVMLQVGSYKLRKKRVFLMAPIHHHFELKGWKENQVVVRFWIISIILLLLGLSSIKLR